VGIGAAESWKPMELERLKFSRQALQLKCGTGLRHVILFLA
jgi:hypothetical protein